MGRKGRYDNNGAGSIARPRGAAHVYRAKGAAAASGGDAAGDERKKAGAALRPALR